MNIYMPYIMQNAFPTLPLLILTKTLWVNYQSHFTDEKPKAGLGKLRYFTKFSNRLVSNTESVVKQLHFNKNLKKKYRIWIQLILFQSLCVIHHAQSLPQQLKWKCCEESKARASLVAQWLRICLLMQGTRVWALVWEDPTCRGATRPMSHNYWACASGACAPQQERTEHRDEERPPLAATGESPRTETKTQHSQK